MWGKIIPMCRLWLHSLYGLYGPQCPLSPEKADKLNLSLWETAAILSSPQCVKRVTYSSYWHIVFLQHFLLRSECEHLIRQGHLEHIVHWGRDDLLWEPQTSVDGLAQDCGITKMLAMEITVLWSAMLRCRSQTWLGARLWYLQCANIGDNTVLG